MQNRSESGKSFVGNQEVPSALQGIYAEVKPVMDSHNLNGGLASIKRTKALLHSESWNTTFVKVRRFQKGMSYVKSIDNIQKKLAIGGLKPRKEKFLRKHLKRLQDLLNIGF